MNCKIEQLPSISAIYYALLQAGYEFYSLEREPRFTRRMESYVIADTALPFFSKVRQSTCAVYPYWPRAYILEAASFYLDEALTGFRDYPSFQRRILSAANISAEEKGAPLWDWIAGFPAALKQAIHSAGFSRYLKWETEWLLGQNDRYRNELRLLDGLLAECRKNEHPGCQKIKIVLCPIKCEYSSDHHIFDSSFVFTSGELRIDSVIHEFMHTVIHPIVEHEIALPRPKQYPDMDASYYLDKSEQGRKNAFEEYAVRMVTEKVMKQEKLPDLRAFLEQVANR